MGESAGHDGAGGRPGARSFDPVAGVRAMADIQAEGLRAAGELLERMLRREPDGPGPPPAAPAGDVAGLVEAWADLLRRVADGLGRPEESATVTVAVDGTGAGPRVRLAPRGPGDAVEVWLHNGTARAVGPLALRCGPLSDAEGHVLDGGDVAFEPPEVAVLPARSSRAVLVSLAPDRPLPAGRYRGAIQAEGAPGLWLPLEVAIEPC
jgi:hypothetical protein